MVKTQKRPHPQTKASEGQCRSGTTAESAALDVTAALRERVKELDCLYEITRLSQRHDWALEEILSGVCGIVARAWQYPEIACVKVTVGGRSFTTPTARRPVAKQSSPIRIHGEVVGHIEVGYCSQRPPCDEGPFLCEERHLLDAVADHLGRIIEARENEERLRQLSQELIKAQEHERQRIARELHDDVGQTLSVTRMHLEGLLPLLGSGDRDALCGVREKVQECSTRLGTSIMALRDLAYNLLPPALSQLGLAETACRLCEDMSARHGITITFFADGMEALRLPFEVSINLYRVLQEGLANACRHGNCSNIAVRLLASYPHCLLHIADDGHGFDPEVRLPQALAEKHMGIWSMRERIRLLGGRFTLRSRPGKGVRIKVEVPVKGQDVCPTP